MWEALKDGMFSIVQFFYNICGDWGLAIIIITVIFRAILTPLMYYQARSNYRMQKMQPEIKKVQEKFKNDRTRQSQEMQKIYAESHFNPLAGCLPMILQIPIFMILFQTLREMGDRTEVQDYSFYNIVPDLVMSPSSAYEEGFLTFIPYLILMIIFAGATFLPMILQQRRNSGQQRNQTLIMGIIMTVFMLWISWGSPAGVLLYWGTSSLLGILQNQLSMRHFRRADARKAAQLAEEDDDEYEVVVQEPVEINVTRKAKKKRPTKKR